MKKTFTRSAAEYALSLDVSQSEWLRSIIAQCGTQLEPCEFVATVNAVHHELGGQDYDRLHKPVLQVDEHIWKELLRSAAAVVSGKEGLSVLDFGCGTGFAAEQIVRFLGPDRIESVTLVDPSAAMLAQAAQRLRKHRVPTVALEDVGGALRAGKRFDIVCENSVLHHLPTPYRTLALLGDALACPGVLIVAQEPNKRFVKGAVGRVNQVVRVLLRMIRPAQAAGQAPDDESPLDRELVSRGVIARPIGKRTLGMIVDFWIPRPWQEERRHEDLGFDIRDMLSTLSRFSLIGSCTYQHLGKPFTRLGRSLQLIDRVLGRLFPGEGEKLGVVFANRSRQ